MPKPKREEAGSLSKFEHQKLQQLLKQGGTAYGSVSDLVQASNLAVSKLRHFLNSKPSCTKTTLATRKFTRKKAFAGFKNGMWFLDCHMLIN